MWFKKLHMFFQSFMKCSICKDLTASSMLPNSHNVMSTETPPLTRCTNASPLLEVHGGWMAKLKWCINTCAINFFKPVLYGHMFFWLWQGNHSFIINFQSFCCCGVQMKFTKRVNFWMEWKVSPRADRNDAIKLTVRKLLPKLISTKNSQNPL